ncbi:hypothetical protein EON65_31110 [archaeon]|nr:MAG: hypothetical protein EON65_31110 [archaeon]
MVSVAIYIVGCIAIFVACTFAAAGGVGGGPFIVPLLMLIFEYSFETSVAISLAVGLGNSVAQFLLNSRVGSPYDPLKPLIWWELVLILLPAQLGGSNIGTLLGYMLPKQILYIIALLILIFAFRVSIVKGMDRRRMELQESREGKLTASSSGEDSNAILPSNDIETNHEHGDANEDEEYDDAYDEEEEDAVEARGKLCGRCDDGSVRVGDIEANTSIYAPNSSAVQSSDSQHTGLTSHTNHTVHSVSSTPNSPGHSVLSSQTEHTEDTAQSVHTVHSSPAALITSHSAPSSQTVHTEAEPPDPVITEPPAFLSTSIMSSIFTDHSIAHDHPPNPADHIIALDLSPIPTDHSITQDHSTTLTAQLPTLDQHAAHTNDDSEPAKSPLKSALTNPSIQHSALDLIVPHLEDMKDFDLEDGRAEKKYSPMPPRPPVKGRTRLIRANTLHGLSRLVDFQGEKRVQLPYKVLIVLTLSWFCYLAIILGRTTVERCSDGYIGLFISAYVPLIACVVWGVIYNRHHIMQQLAEDDDPSLKRAHDDFRSIENKMLNENYIMLPIFTLGIGIVCALLGIGGGELFGPMMLHNHLSPVVTSATSSTLGLFNSLALVIRYIVQDEMSYNTGVILFFVGFFGGLLGRQLGLMFTVKYNRSSVIIFALCGAIFLGAIYYVYQLIALPFDIQLSNLCTVK